MSQPRNLPRDELLAHAQEAMDKFPGRATVFFKFTCEKCGTRVTFSEPNTLFEKGECCDCGHSQDVTEGGYILHIESPPEVQKYQLEFDPERN